jgi:hypothetical protein
LDNEEETVDNKTTNQTPGLISIMVTLGLLSLLIIKRSQLFFKLYFARDFQRFFRLLIPFFPQE